MTNKGEKEQQALQDLRHDLLNSAQILEAALCRMSKALKKFQEAVKENGL